MQTKPNQFLPRNDKKCVALVHPIKDTKKRQSGIVVVNSRTTKPKCHTCEGKKSVHVNIYMEGASNEDTVEVNVEDDLPTKKMDNKSLNSTNQFDPLKKRGKESNVFCVKINFPPNKSEKNEIDKINRETNLFTEGYAISDLQPGESCDHGYEYIHKINFGNCEATKPHWDNHTTCSQAYCMDEYPSLKLVNSQVSEQTIRSLTKLSVVLAYYGWENYLRVLELFLVSRNLRNKKLLV